METRYRDFQALRVRVERGVAFLTIDHPPVNLLDELLIEELDRAARELEADPQVRVAVVRSANPSFFVAHADVRLILELAREAGTEPARHGVVQAMVERFRTLSKATIGEIAGAARGGGSELLLSLDMRFGAIDRAILSQPEIAFGIIPGGGGTQRLPRIVGRGRALEIVLGGGDFDAELAERYGYINRALPAEELAPFVESLAFRIASFPASAIALAKAALDAAELPTTEGLKKEADYFARALATRDARHRLAAFVALGGQTRNGKAQADEIA